MMVQEVYECQWNQHIIQYASCYIYKNFVVVVVVVVVVVSVCYKCN